ncbi:HAD family hydrolase [Palleronia sediminis]|uniref:HAD family hydrolase n=2 Tax=Palleronia sediminis TaxID=2547833 RepID=A0A4R6AK57_9RHOB|nr:HAD family hydrolase [Palleronia sediminis]
MTSALLFDLDGTMIHSDPIHADIFIGLFAERGLTIDEGYYAENIQGRMNEDLFAEVFPDEDAQALSIEKERRFRERLNEAGPVAGLPALLDRAEAAGWGKACVTNAPRVNAEAMLGALGIADRFDEIVIADELARGKPDPLPYLTAMERLGVAAGNCLAFEDSRLGIRAATAAGAVTIGMRTLLDDAALRDAGAAASIADFDDPALSPFLDRLETTAR